MRMLNKIVNENYRAAFIMIGAIILGSIIGFFAQGTSSFVGGYLDYIILALVFLLFFELPIENIVKRVKNIKFISITWLTNFVVIPTIGFLIASLFFRGEPLFFIGLLIYFLAPCTDWFLGFIKLAKGDTAMGAVLMPINMISQLLLFPVYMLIFAQSAIAIDFAGMFDTLLNWFLIPFVLAVILHFAVRKLLQKKIQKTIATGTAALIEFVLALLVFVIFAANSTTIFEHLDKAALILLAVLIFFVTVYFVTERISTWLKFPHAQRAVYTITTSARNAPLMLALAAAVFPDQPLIYAAIIIGMLVEFPQLTFLSVLLKKQA